MKYLKLFEAFESNILTKTLGFIKNTESRKIFMERLDKICSSIDFPKSQLKDDFFQYLSFNKALKLSAMTGDEPCDATSANAFPQYAVEGATCKGGKILRKWGARTREVECPICSGTGIKKKKPELKLIKFWFSSEGQFIDASAVDGLIRNKHLSPVNFISKDINDYKVVDSGSHTDLKHGDIVRVSINRRPTIGIIFKSGSSVYIVQDEHSGTSPAGSEWRKWGRYTWQLARGEYQMPIEILKPLKEEEEVETEVDPYTWNVGMSWHRWSGISVDENKDLKEVLKDAHFAIVMDFGKIKQSGFKTQYQIRSGREESREGALALEKPEDVRTANIERYTKAIADKLASGDELTKVTRSIPKFMGGPNVLIYIYIGRGFSDLNTLIDRLYNFIKEEDEDDKEYWAKEIINSIKRTYENGSQWNSDLNNKIMEINKRLVKENKTEHQQLFSRAMKLSEKINKDVLQAKVENIEDIEFVYQKLNTIRNMVKSSRSSLGKLQYFMERFNYEDTNRTYQRLLEINQDSIPNIIESIETLERWIDRS